MDAATQRILLIDTCGETAGVALCLGPEVLVAQELAAGAGSAQIVAAVRRSLETPGWSMPELDAVGVVGGPGSFTGVRTGLAAAKGFCEAASLRLVVVSRLAVLAHAAGRTGGLAVLNAGRGELYVREIEAGREWLCAGDALPEGEIVAAEAVIAERLAGRGAALRPLHVSDALPLVLQALSEGGEDVALAEANYVRGEQNIYGKQRQP
jgi:tRNA threonylcarbamoyladenosine biosynthesis protein TsaB